MPRKCPAIASLEIRADLSGRSSFLALETWWNNRRAQEFSTLAPSSEANGDEAEQVHCRRLRDGCRYYGQ